MSRPDLSAGPGCVAVVGITDLGAASLLPEARALVEQAEVLYGGKRHLAFFSDHPAERFAITNNLLQMVERLRAERRSTVVLASGDPDCYGIGPFLVEQLGAERVRIFPNLSSVQLAFARLGESWHDAAILSAHGRPLEAILPAALLAPKAAILTDERNNPSAVAQALLDAGDEDATVDVFEHLGGPTERHVHGHLSDVVGREFAALNLLVVRHQRPPRPWPLGLPEEAFAHRGSFITKAEVRAVALSKLRLHDRALLWDIGAGCGSVGVEAAGLLRQGRVYAVERDGEQLAYLSENQGRFGAGNLTIVAGEAPEALANLPRPDAIFVGGSGGRLDEIVATSMERLDEAGRIVLDLVSLEHVGQVLQLGQRGGWQAEVVQVSIARSTTTVGLTRLAALNPTFVVSLWREGRAPS